MSALNLSFRQKRILYTLQYASGPVTGSALSKALHVTTRTISSDIRVINQVLVPLHASIIPVKSHGYLYQADDPELLKSMNRFNDAFLTRENRIRYLAARLAFSDEPINLYDLEDEMFVSSTTLHHDIAGLKERCFNGSPHIRIITKKNKISFEESELKRRYILNQMYFQDWDYQSKGNSYYYFDYLDDDLLDLIIVTNCSALYENGIRIEDPCLVSLHIAAAIMCKRVKAGHNLDEVPAVQSVSDEAAMSASRMIVERLSSRLDLSFNEAEVIHLYERIASGHLFPAGSITALTEKDLLDEKVIRTARDFLDQINCLFHIDLSADEDFYITLLQYIDFIRRPVYVFNYQFDSELIKNRYSVELEMALLFLEPALYNLNCRIGKAALLYLADMLSGALDNFFNIHPEFKINVATCCHLNLPSIWALKRRLMSSFGTYLNLVAMFPVNASNIYDFSGINLIISTVSRALLHHPEIDTIIISPFLNAFFADISLSKTASVKM